MFCFHEDNSDLEFGRQFRHQVTQIVNYGWRKGRVLEQRKEAENGWLSLEVEERFVFAKLLKNFKVLGHSSAAIFDQFVGDAIENNIEFLIVLESIFAKRRRLDYLLDSLT